MAEKSIVIIGAGIAGLSAGCYGRMNGYRVQIFEQESRPGGLCTSWERKGYTIHGNMAFLVGSGPGLGFHRLWQELGVVPRIRMIDYEYLLVIEGQGGKAFRLHTDVDRLEEHMKELAPEDKDLTDDFIRGIRIFARYNLPTDKAPELPSPFDKIGILLTKYPLLRAMNKWKKIPIGEFALRFKNPFLSRSFAELKLLFADDLPVAFIQAALAWSHRKSCGFPEGGALRFARAIEQRYLELGGSIHYGTRVMKILTENGRAVGIRRGDGRDLFADYVVSAADGRMTIFDLLEGKYADQKIRNYYHELPISAPVILAAFGVSRCFDDLPRSSLGIIRFLHQPVVVGGKEFHSLRPTVYNFDSTLAPRGKTLIRFVIPADYDYWKSLGQSPEGYQAEKESISGTLTSFLDEWFPGLASQVEMWDVATPLTFERYTGNWKASIIGWDATRKTFFMRMNKTLPGLSNFYMAGQWVEPGGGLPMVAASGRNVIQLICTQDKKLFTAVSA